MTNDTSALCCYSCIVYKAQLSAPTQDTVVANGHKKSAFQCNKWQKSITKNNNLYVGKLQNNFFITSVLLQLNEKNK